MITFEQVSVTYDGADEPALHDVDLRVPEGELCLVVGRTGTGKSTLLRTVNGLVPHFTGGTLTGRVMVDGRDTRTHPPRELADVVGFVGQDPSAGFVTDVVEDELAYAMESIGLAPPVMRRRVEETLDLLGLADLRDRPLRTLSGGQRQRVAIGSVLTAHPRVLVLDEPTSALDPGAAEEVLAALQRLVHDLGLTVLMAEHRLERVVQYADRVVRLVGGQAAPEVGLPAHVMASSSVAPPVVHLGRVAGWDPLPLSVRDARRAAGPLRARLDGLEPVRRGRPPAQPTGARRPARRRDDHRRDGAVRRRRRTAPPLARAAARRGRRGDGPQRRRQVHAARRAGGRRAADDRPGPGDRRRPGVAGRPGAAAPRSGSSRRRPATCCTPRPSRRSAPPPTTTPGSRPARRSRCSSG